MVIVTLTDLEKHATDYYAGDKEEIYALSDIGVFLLSQKKKEERAWSPTAEALIQSSIPYVENVWKIVSDNMNSALASPSAYVREWAKFVKHETSK